MKAKNVIIVVLLAIIVAQFIQYLLLLKKFDQLSLDFVYREIPPKVYIAGLTERFQEIDQIRSEVIWQARWLSRRLGKCIELLEQQKGLEPIPVEYLKPDLMPHLRYDPNLAKRYEVESIPFYEPYEGPNTPPLKDIEEVNVRALMCQINIRLVSLKFFIEPLKAHIVNYDKRLARLAATQP